MHTPEDFLKYHFKPCATPAAVEPPSTLDTACPAAEGDDDVECAICQQPYGSENLAVMQRDAKYGVTGYPNCNHMFDRACVKQLIRLTEKSWVRCPLCRAEWCYIYDDDDSESHPLALRHFYTEKTILLYALDYASLRYYLYHEPEYEASRLDGTSVGDGISAIEMIEGAVAWRSEFRDALHTPKFAARLAELRYNCSATLDNPGLDPWDPCVLLPGGSQNEYAYTNWHADTDMLAQVLTHAMSSSRRGFRVIGGLIGQLDSWTAKDPLSFGDEAFEIGKKSWKVVRADDDE